MVFIIFKSTPNQINDVPSFKSYAHHSRRPKKLFTFSPSDDHSRRISCQNAKGKQFNQSNNETKSVPPTQIFEFIFLGIFL